LFAEYAHQVGVSTTNLNLQEKASPHLQEARHNCPENDFTLKARIADMFAGTICGCE